MTKRYIEALKHALMTLEWIEKREAFKKEIGNPRDNTLEHVEVSIKEIKEALNNTQ